MLQMGKLRFGEVMSLTQLTWQCEASLGFEGSLSGPFLGMHGACSEKENAKNWEEPRLPT